MNIQDALLKWAVSSAGKKKLREAQNKAMQSGKAFGTAAEDTPVTTDLIRQYAEDAITAILDHLPPSLSRSLNRSSFMEPVITKKGNAFHVALSFRPDAVHRDSLQPKEWTQGVENIVVHLSNGWSARGSVRGDWYGMETWSRSDYAGDDFMADAIHDFNLSHPLALAELGGKYNV